MPSYTPEDIRLRVDTAMRNGSKIPERSLIQRMEALNTANDVRVQRAELKRDLKAKRESIYNVLLNPPECAKTAKILEMLLACPTYGRVKADRILRICRISPSKTLEGMTVRQRTELASMLRR